MQVVEDTRIIRGRSIGLCHNHAQFLQLRPMGIIGNIDVHECSLESASLYTLFQDSLEALQNL